MAVPMRVASTMWSRRPTCSRAVPLAYSHLHGGDDHSLAAEPPDLAIQLVPGVVPRLPDQLGPAGDLGVTRPPASLAGSRAVIVPRPDRDAQDKPCRYPARDDQLGEILPGQVRGKGHRRPVRGARRADRGADGRELQPAEGKFPPRQPDAHHPVPAQRGALGGHPADSGVPGLVHGLHERAERARPAPPGYLGRQPGRHPVTGRSLGPGAAISAGGPGAVDSRAEHLADRFETRAADRGELVSRQRRSPRAARPDTRHPRSGYRGQFVAHPLSLGLPRRDPGAPASPCLGRGHAAAPSLPAAPGGCNTRTVICMRSLKPSFW